MLTITPYRTTCNFRKPASFGARIGTPQNLPTDVTDKILNNTISEHFVPTPKDISTLMLDRIGTIKPPDRVLEPSAGSGHLVDALIKRGVNASQIDVIEPVEELREILAQKGVNIVSKDILQYTPEEKYDKIIMNPPYDNGLDILHTLKCFSILKKGGKLVAVLPESAFLPTGLKGSEKWKKDWLNNGESKEINEYLKDLLTSKKVSSRVWKLPKCAFYKSDVPDNVQTRMILIEKLK